jgi:hypothetical protein
MGGMHVKADWVEPEPEWSKFRLAQFGYITIHIPANDHTRMQIVYNGETAGQVYDSVWIEKKH